MSNLVVIIICLCIGLLLQKNSRLPDSFAASLNSYVIYVALPALILYEIPHLKLDKAALLPVIFAWGIMATSALFIFALARFMRWPSGVTGALMLTVPLGNTGFVGIPLIEAFLGKDAIPYAILYDQMGTFIALNTFGSFIAAYYSGTGTSWKKLFTLIVSFPPFLALLFAFALLPLHLPASIFKALQQISSTLVPVVMVAVGLQWRLRMDREIIIPLCVGIVATLALKPLLAWVALAGVGEHGIAARVIVLEAAMPAMISAGVLAINYQLSPRLASSLVGYSLLLSLVTVWMWSQILT